MGCKYSIVQDIYWEADIYSLNPLLKPKTSFPYPQASATGPLEKHVIKSSLSYPIYSCSFPHPQASATGLLAKWVN
jgi:hypothetical protein